MVGTGDNAPRLGGCCGPGRPSRRGARCSSTRCGQRDAGTVEAHGALLPANEAEAVEPRGALLLNDNAAADSTNGHTTGQVYDAQDTTLLDLHERQQQGHGFIGTILASDPSLFGAMLYDTPSVEDPQTAPSGFIASALESDLSLLEGVPNSRLAPGQDPLVEDTNAQGHMEVISWADACASEARRGTWDGIPATVQILLAQNLPWMMHSCPRLAAIGRLLTTRLWRPRLTPQPNLWLMRPATELGICPATAQVRGAQPGCWRWAWP